MKRFQFIICKVMQREAYYCAARSENTIDIVMMPQGLHNEPAKLREEVQRALDKTSDVQGRPYDASLLGYGLCSNGIVGLESKIPLVVPRGHDCVTLLLGSKEKYQQYFDEHSGVYWYSGGWIETSTQPGKERYERTLAEYKERYGEDNAKYLMELEQEWIKKYNWATYIDWHLANSENEKAYTKKCADYLGWNFEAVEGDPSLMRRLVDGKWDKEDFLVIEPGQKISEDLTNAGIIKAE